MHRPASIVVVDDELAVRQVLVDLFSREAFTVRDACTSEELMDIMKTVDVDLITLDLGLSVESGFDILRQLRSTSDVGIVLVTGKDDLIDKVTGLEMGADDYIAKPFELREVLARVRSVLRRRAARNVSINTTPSPRATEAPWLFEFADWALSQATLDLRHKDGELRDLTTNEFRILELFVSNPNRVLSRDEIMDHLRGVEWSPTDRSIDNYIARLRRKINTGTTGELIKTVRGQGYQFTASVKRRKLAPSQSA